MEVSNVSTIFHYGSCWAFRNGLWAGLADHDLSPSRPSVLARNLRAKCAEYIDQKDDSRNDWRNEWMGVCSLWS